MKVLVFDADAAVRKAFDAALAGHELVYVDAPVSAEALREHPDAEAVSVFVSSELRRGEIDLLPKLRLIVARSTGLDHVDVAHAEGKGIAVRNVARYGAHTVAEFTFALLLAVSRRVCEASRRLRADGVFDTMAMEGLDLFGKTIGVVGTGAIGRHVVGIAKGFGMRVAMHDARPDPALESESARYATLDELLAAADVVTLHVPATAENRHLIGEAAIGRMKPGAILVNTARGELVDTAALVAALRDGRLAGAGLDVLEEERALKDKAAVATQASSAAALRTIIQDHALIDMPHVVITPHIAFFSREAYREILGTAAREAAEFIAHA
jgi:D-lactate dehydrogenase